MPTAGRLRDCCIKCCDILNIREVGQRRRKALLRKRKDLASGVKSEFQVFFCIPQAVFELQQKEFAARTVRAVIVNKTQAVGKLFARCFVIIVEKALAWNFNNILNLHTILDIIAII